MADSKISDLSAVTTVSDTDEYVLARAGATNKITGANLKATLKTYFDTLYQPVGSSGGLTLIASGTLGASAASIDITSIPGTYKNLILYLTARGDVAALGDSAIFRFNNDSGSNYDAERVDWDGSSNAPAAYVAATSIAMYGAIGATAPANMAASAVFYIPNYAGTTFFKGLFRMMGVRYDTSKPLMSTLWGGWRSTAAITRITITSQSNFVAGTAYSLYGTA